jgi:hypothetical protein
MKRLTRLSRRRAVKYSAMTRLSVEGMCICVPDQSPSQSSLSIERVALIELEFGLVHIPSDRYNPSCWLQGGPSASCVSGMGQLAGARPARGLHEILHQLNDWRKRLEGDWRVLGTTGQIGRQTIYPGWNME